MKKELLYYEAPELATAAVALGQTLCQSITSFDDDLNPDYDDPIDL